MGLVLAVKGEHPRQQHRLLGEFSIQGFRVQDSGFRVQGSGFRVQGSGCRVQDLGLLQLTLEFLLLCYSRAYS